MKTSKNIQVEFLNSGMIKKASLRLPNKGRPLTLEAEHSLAYVEPQQAKRVIQWETKSCRSGHELHENEITVKVKLLLEDVVKAARMTDEEFNAACKVRAELETKFREEFYGS